MRATTIAAQKESPCNNVQPKFQEFTYGQTRSIVNTPQSLCL